MNPYDLSAARRNSPAGRRKAVAPKPPTPDEIIAEMERWEDDAAGDRGSYSPDVIALVRHMREWFASRATVKS